MDAVLYVRMFYLKIEAQNRMAARNSILIKKKFTYSNLKQYICNHYQMPDIQDVERLEARS